MKAFILKKIPLFLAFAALAVLFLYGCQMRTLEEMLQEADQIQIESQKKENVAASDYYEKFYIEMTQRAARQRGTSLIRALDSLPKDPAGQVNWTAAVVEGLINPKGSLDPEALEEPPLNLNIFIEAKVPLMANVVFPHSIHTYWLSCNNCHPKIFIPEAGANPISMDEIFKGQWCGRCHGKVAFTFWPRENCVRCHIVLKGQSLEKESFK